MEERPAGCLVAADLTFTWTQGRGCVTAVDNSNTGISFNWEIGISSLTVKKQRLSRKEFPLDWKEMPREEEIHPSPMHNSTPRPGSGLPPVTDPALQPAPGLRDPTRRETHAFVCKNEPAIYG